MYYTVVMADRNYAGIADRFDHKAEWANLARMNNFAPVKIGARVRIPDEWVRNSHPAMFRQRRIAQPVQRVQPMFRGQVNGVQGMRPFGVGQSTTNAADTANNTGEVTQDQCMTAMQSFTVTGNPIYENLIAKYGQESADKRWAMISKAACYDKQYMIQVPWGKLAGAVGLGVLLGVGATYAGMKMME